MVSLTDEMRRRRDRLLEELYAPGMDLNTLLKIFNERVRESNEIVYLCQYCHNYHPYQINTEITMAYRLCTIGLISEEERDRVIDRIQTPKKKRRNAATYYANKNVVKKKCEHCGSTQNLQVHHILPVADGGTDDPENLRVLCETCHKETHKYGQPLNRRLRRAMEKRKRMDEKKKRHHTYRISKTYHSSPED